MLNNNVEKLNFSKIEIGKDSEPKIVNASEKEVLKNLSSPKELPVEEVAHSIGKQMAMKNVIGIDNINVTNKRQKILNVLVTWLFIVFVVALVNFLQLFITVFFFFFFFFCKNI